MFNSFLTNFINIYTFFMKHDCGIAVLMFFQEKISSVPLTNPSSHLSPLYWFIVSVFSLLTIGYIHLIVHSYKLVGIRKLLVIRCLVHANTHYLIAFFRNSSFNLSPILNHLRLIQNYKNYIF